MTPLKLLLPAAIAFALASCAGNKSDQYDTASNQYGPADGAVNQPANETYDTPPAYEDAGATTATNPNIPADPGSNLPPANKPPINPAPTYSGRIATTHTIVAGDTLSGIAAKYKVSAASIKQANGMTKDIVVLGKKMKIPAP